MAEGLVGEQRRRVGVGGEVRGVEWDVSFPAGGDRVSIDSERLGCSTPVRSHCMHAELSGAEIDRVI